jgi:transposase-like protein
MGRKIKLTADTAKIIIDAVRDGYTLKSIAKLAGITESTLYFWRQLGTGAGASSPFSEFSESLRAAQAEARQIAVKANPRPLARARYEREESDDAIRQKASAEIVRCMREGRVPYALALQALDEARDMLEEANDHPWGEAWSGGMDRHENPSRPDNIKSPDPQRWGKLTEYVPDKRGQVEQILARAFCDAGIDVESEEKWACLCQCASKEFKTELARSLAKLAAKHTHNKPRKDNAKTKTKTR